MRATLDHIEKEKHEGGLGSKGIMTATRDYRVYRAYAPGRTKAAPHGVK